MSSYIAYMDPMGKDWVKVNSFYALDETFQNEMELFSTMLQASLLREMLQLQLPDDGDRLRMQTCLSIHRTHGDWN